MHNVRYSITDHMAPAGDMTHDTCSNVSAIRRYSITDHMAPAMSPDSADV